MSGRSICLIVDYRDAFCSNISTMSGNVSMDTASITANFQQMGYVCSTKKFSDLDLSEHDLDTVFLYTSSEDYGLLYKSYIEDCITAMEMAGAIVLPRYPLLRAHHNKCAMEGVRAVLFPEQARNLETRIFGAFEEAEAADFGDEWPKVVKSSYGAGSATVGLARNRDELLSLARKYSTSHLTWSEIAREHAKRLLRREWHPRSLHRNKFIVQNMITNLRGDFKVLCFGKKFYTLYRKNRPGDFRASGSGIFSEEIPESVNGSALLDYAEDVYKTLDCPIASLDIAFDGDNFHLIEFQALHFGTLTAERSTGYFIRQGADWVREPGTTNIEQIYCEAIDRYLRDRHEAAPPAAGTK